MTKRRLTEKANIKAKRITSVLLIVNSASIKNLIATPIDSATAGIRSVATSGRATEFVLISHMAIELTPQELSRRYNRVARWYDRVEGVLGLLGVSRLRRRVLQQASGKVLEVAAGTGKNLPYYPHECRIIAVDLSREMLNIAQKRAAKLSMNVSFLLADAEALPFSDESFDTVVSSLSTCTFPNPVAALQEMARVCRPTGKVLLLEHGRSDRERLGRWQDRHADQFAKPLGCHWNREPLEHVGQTGLKVYRAKRNFFGIFQQIESLKMAPQSENGELS